MMHFEPGGIYHVYNQGNNRQMVFLEEEEYQLFLNLYKKTITPHCYTLAWCLMPNHFHFLVQADQRSIHKLKQGGNLLDPITNGIRKLLSGYSRITNTIHKRSGSVFRQKTKSKLLNDPFHPGLLTEYTTTCFHYIHQNPVKAGLTDHPGNWEHSSFASYIYDKDDGITDMGRAAMHGLLFQAKKELQSPREISEDVIKKIT